jgi:hypothetical protein
MRAVLEAAAKLHDELIVGGGRAASTTALLVLESARAVLADDTDAAARAGAAGAAIVVLHELVAAASSGAGTGALELRAGLRALDVLENLAYPQGGAPSSGIVALRLRGRAGMALPALGLALALEAYAPPEGVLAARTADAPAHGVRVRLSVGDATVQLRARLLAFALRASTGAQVDALPPCEREQAASAGGEECSFFIALAETSAHKVLASLEGEGATAAFDCDGGLIFVGGAAGAAAAAASRGGSVIVGLVSARSVPIAVPRTRVVCASSPAAAAAALVGQYRAALGDNLGGVPMAMARAAVAMSPLSQVAPVAEAAAGGTGPAAADVLRAAARAASAVTQSTLRSASAGLRALTGDGDAAGVTNEAFDAASAAGTLLSVLAAGATMGLSGAASTLAVAAASSIASHFVLETRRRTTFSPLLVAAAAPAAAAIPAAEEEEEEEEVEEDWAFL